MAEKKARKKDIKKAALKKVKTAVKKSPSRAKPKTTGKSKPASKKSALKNPVLKPKPKTTGKIFTPKKTENQKSEAERKAALRKTLIAKREAIVKEAKSEISKYIKGETRQLVDTALDDGDWSVVDLSEDISLRQLSTHKDTLRKIDEALRKLDEGTYGICEDCGEEISEERLKILPFAIYCTDCQERREQIEEMEKEKA